MKCCINNGSWKSLVRRRILDQLHNRTLLFEPPKFKSNPLAKYPKAEDSQLCIDYLTARQIPKKWWKDFYFVEKAQSLSSINYKYNKRVF